MKFLFICDFVFNLLQCLLKSGIPGTDIDDWVENIRKVSMTRFINWYGLHANEWWFHVKQRNMCWTSLDVNNISSIKSVIYKNL